MKEETDLLDPEYIPDTLEQLRAQVQALVRANEARGVEVDDLARRFPREPMPVSLPPLLRMDYAFLTMKRDWVWVSGRAVEGGAMQPSATPAVEIKLINALSDRGWRICRTFSAGEQVTLILHRPQGGEVLTQDEIRSLVGGAGDAGRV